MFHTKFPGEGGEGVGIPLTLSRFAHEFVEEKCIMYSHVTEIVLFMKREYTGHRDMIKYIMILLKPSNIFTKRFII